jgi:Spy/CpxP family protein refolding chaperone
MKNLVFVISILLGVTLLNLNNFAQNMDHPKMDKMKMRMNMKQQLNLSEEQEKKIEALKLSHEEQMINLRADLDRKNLEMKKLKASNNFSRADVIKITKDINAIKDEIALAKVNLQMDVYENLDPSQQKIFLQM